MWHRDVASTVALALKLAWAGRVRLVLSVVLVALAMTVFLVVTQLSAIGAQGLDEAIDAESGVPGSYAVEMQTSFGLDRGQLVDAVHDALDPVSSEPIPYVVGYPDIQPECPPYDTLGRGMVRFVYNADGTPYALPYGADVPSDTEVCLAGQAVPATGIFVPSAAQESRWGLSLLFVAPAYEHVAALMTAEPVAYRFVVTTGRDDSEQTIRAALRQRLGDTALRFGSSVDEATVDVARLDGGQQVRAASQGIKTIFGVIGWGVLGLGALGLLISQLIVVRDRMWLFGLGTALGARRLHVAILVAVDVVLTVVLGVAAAVLVAVLAQPVTDQVARSTFGTDADLLNPGALARLVLGAAAVLVVASTWPVLRATSQDPLDVLEPKVS
ncbi:hypothetical protein GCM10027215_39770 [Nocardioides zeae]